MFHLLKRVWVVSSWALALAALVLSPLAFASDDCEITCEKCVVDLRDGTAECSNCTVSGCEFAIGGPG